MFRISMQQAGTKGMLHYLEHSSNCATVLFIWIYYNLYIMIYIYIMYIYTKRCSPLFTVYRYMFSLPPKSQRLASTVEAFWRLHQLEDVARRFSNGKMERVGQW